jgi:predicted dehydrogenase
LKIGVIGAGRIVRFHLDSLVELGFEIHGIAARKNSVGISGLVNEYKIPNAYESHLELFKLDLDAILIASSSSSLLEIWQDAVVLGIPILVEKPLFLDSVSQRFFDTDYPNVIVGYNRRFYSSVKQLKVKLESSKGGNFVFNVPEISWEKNPSLESVVDNIRNNTVHGIDLLRYVFDDLEFDLSGSKFTGGNQNMNLLVPAGNKIFNGVVNLSFGAPARYSLDVYDNESNFGLAPLEDYYEFNSIKVQEPTENNPIRRYVPYSDIDFKISHDDVKFKPGFFLQSKELLGLCKGEKALIGASISDAAYVSQIVEELITLIKP